jgi:predicted enzyme involved in methoxymalonyl-ACP biosynthesis
MSCRAFSRRIEHGCVLRVIHKFGIEQATFDFVKTPRNQPIQTFLGELMGDASSSTYSITRERLFNNCPPVYLQIQENEDE